jgi:hypothetical protein
MKMPPKKQRKGSLTFELLLVLPILLILMVGMIQMSLTLMCRQQLLGASREAARVAALGGNHKSVVLAAKQCLGDGRLGEAEILLTTGEGKPIRSAQEVRSGESIQVWISIPAEQAVPNFLAFAGFQSKDELIVARTVMRKE